MYYNHIFVDVNQALPKLLLHLLNEGDEVNSRAGKTLELNHIGITLTEPWRREILLPERKPSLAAQIAETMWVLSGGDDIVWLSHYLPRAKDFSDDGQTWRAAYGKRLRSWPRRDGSGDVIDQLRYVVDTLRSSSLSRQAVMTLWDPQIDTQPGKDIPCNDWISFSNRLGALDMHVALRSNDVIWGWSGINQFEWSSLLEIVAGLLGVRTGSLHFSTTSFHIYEHHWGKAKKIVDECSLTYPARAEDSPRFSFTGDFDEFDMLCVRWFELEKRIRHGDFAKAEVEAFPEPMLQSWLRVLQWWWSGSREFLFPLHGTALELATHYSIQPKTVSIQVSPGRCNFPGPNDWECVRDLGHDGDHGYGGVFWPQEPTRFIDRVIALHNEKHAAYGDSWKRRGEILGILANIARKVDRLGGAETSDETSADTATDLFVYLAKYRVWLDDPRMSDTPDAANDLMRTVASEYLALCSMHRESLENQIRSDFDQLEGFVVNGVPRKGHVSKMLHDAYLLAYFLAVTTDEYQGADHD